MVRLPDRDAVRDYLIERFVPAEDAAAAARRVGTPVTVTKRGAVVYARRSPAVALISMPLAVGCVLVFGFARFVPLRGSVGVEHDS